MPSSVLRRNPAMSPGSHLLFVHLGGGLEDKQRRLCLVKHFQTCSEANEPHQSSLLPRDRVLCGPLGTAPPLDFSRREGLWKLLERWNPRLRRTG